MGRRFARRGQPRRKSLERFAKLVGTNNAKVGSEAGEHACDPVQRVGAHDQSRADPLRLELGERRGDSRGDVFHGGIDKHLDLDLRATYLQMRAGKAVPKHQRRAVEQAVREILGDALEESAV